MHLLLCTNGSPDTRLALDYGAWLAERLGGTVTLLGVVERPPHRPAVEALIEEFRPRLQEAGVWCTPVLAEGPLARALPAQAGPHMLTVVSPMRRRFLWPPLFSQLLAAMEGPVLHVGATRPQLERFLLCAGGLRYAEAMVRLGGLLARAVGGTVTLLHVVEPVTLEYPLAEEIKNHWQDLLETDTPQAHYLREALEGLGQLGVPAEVRVRHGPVVQQILQEIREREYDLVGVGSPYAARSLRRLYRPNVAVEVAEAAERPVLIARSLPTAV